MPEIRLEHVTKRWGKFYAVDDLNLVIDNNSFVTLLGPSGCGKTTTLRMIAGLETPTSGRITIGDQVVFDSALGINIPANKRKVGFLFQNYALWPNMTVYDNISFGLSNIKEPLPKIDFEAKNAARLAEILQAPGEVVKILEDCRDKSGKIDEKKAHIKLVDAFTISIYTAKKLYSYHLEQGRDLSGEIAALQAKADAARKNQTLDENFQVLRDGQVATETRKLSREEIDLSVRRVSRIVKIGMFMDRYPAELSGGQQQRVAIARTLAPEPSVLFMDEPLSNLDAKLRVQMRVELIELHQKLRTTFVYVTHDQVEAMSMADTIILMNGGVIQQMASPAEIYKDPANLFTACFIGSPSMNIWKMAGDRFSFGFRPEHCTLTFDPQPTFLCIPGRVATREMLGSETIYKFVSADGRECMVKEMADTCHVNDEVYLNIPEDRAYLFAADGSRIRTGDPDYAPDLAAVKEEIPHEEESA